jgi:hypothetical protein
MIPKRSLSGLFNIPTLVAYEDGCDYFYIANDDLLIKSEGWTEALVNPILNNPIYPGLGVSGGVDVSDSETPQIEFPFFGRLHVCPSPHLYLLEIDLSRLGRALSLVWDQPVDFQKLVILLFVI